MIARLSLPLTLQSGVVAGVVAAIDNRSRIWTDSDMRRLRSIARMVEKMMGTRISKSRWRSLFEELHKAFILGRIACDGHDRIVNRRYTD